MIPVGSSWAHYSALMIWCNNMPLPHIHSLALFFFHDDDGSFVFHFIAIKNKQKGNLCCEYISWDGCWKLNLILSQSAHRIWYKVTPKINKVQHNGICCSTSVFKTNLRANFLMKTYVALTLTFWLYLSCYNWCFDVVFKKNHANGCTISSTVFPKGVHQLLLAKMTLNLVNRLMHQQEERFKQYFFVSHFLVL